VGGCRLPSLVRHGIRATLAREVNFGEPPTPEVPRMPFHEHE
jgi:hypothetical protein